MFEKEAGDYALVSLPDGYTKIDHQKRVDFQKGAEFGYNNGKEEAKTIIQDLLNNFDEYARQRAIDFLKEIECQSSTNS